MISIAGTDIRPAARQAVASKSQSKGRSRGQLVAFMGAAALLAFVVVLLAAGVTYMVFAAV